MFIMFFTYMLLVGFVTAQTLNLLSTYVLVRHKKLKSVSNCYQMSLSVCMMISMLLSAWVHPLRMTDRDLYERHVIFRAIQDWGENFFIVCAVLNLSAQDFERYIGLCRPLKAKTGISLNRTHKIICFLWLVSIVTSIPSFLCGFTSGSVGPSGLGGNRIPNVRLVSALSLNTTDDVVSNHNDTNSEEYCQNQDTTMASICRQRENLSPVICFILLFCLPLLSNLYLFVSIIRRLRKSVCFQPGHTRKSSKFSISSEKERNPPPQERRRRFGTTVRYNTVRKLEDVPRISVISASETTGANPVPQKHLEPSPGVCSVRHSFAGLEMKPSTPSEAHPSACSELNIELETSVGSSSYNKQEDTKLGGSASLCHITGTNNNINECTAACLGVVEEKPQSASDSAMYVRVSTPNRNVRYGRKSNARTPRYSNATCRTSVGKNTHCDVKNSRCDATQRIRRMTEVTLPPSMKMPSSRSYVFTRSQSEQRISAGRSLRNYCYTTVFPDTSYELRHCSSTNVSNTGRASKHKNDRKISAASGYTNSGKSYKSNFSKNDSDSICSVGLEIAPTWLWRVRMRAVKNLAIGIAVYVMHWLPVHILRMNSTKSSSSSDPTCTCCPTSFSEVYQTVFGFWMCVIAASTPFLHCVCSKKFRCVYITLLRTIASKCKPNLKCLRIN
uniref:uncharacterized protein LOC113474851 n=1 Tax=Ciona intestinalis TaxID=7719 RepID=UPI000EF4FD97|nr:uncharacterized protein LOC113474851 [Ciona intestinalis]|eukprot:XP_026693374.1 uncharacterized protein LOC113474851 [Ciona intestinalis]